MSNQITCLDDVRGTIGDAIDAAMAPLGFTVPDAEFCDLNQVYQFADLPRIVFYWSLDPWMELLRDIVTTKDLEEMTAVTQEWIPHRITIQIKAMSVFMLEADEMAEAVLKQFGYSPCFEGIPLLYQGISDSSDEFKLGVFDRTLTYSGSLFLKGRSVNSQLVESIDLDLQVASQIVQAEGGGGGPEPNPTDVSVDETTHDTLEI